MENGKLPRINFQRVELAPHQQGAIDAICRHNNFILMTKDGKKTKLLMNCDTKVLTEGLRELASQKGILDIMTDIVIDLQNERK